VRVAIVIALTIVACGGGDEAPSGPKREIKSSDEYKAVSTEIIGKLRDISTETDCDRFGKRLAAFVKADKPTFDALKAWAKNEDHDKDTKGMNEMAAPTMKESVPRLIALMDKCKDSSVVQDAISKME
jgi:hypothetical protein